MAKLMPYTDPYGVAHPDAVWIPNEVHIAHSDGAVRVVFAAWHNAAALAAGKTPLAGACKEYALTGAAYHALAQTAPAAGQTTLFGVISQACYDHLTVIPDVPAPTEQDPNRKVSFFADAADFDLPT